MHIQGCVTAILAMSSIAIALPENQAVVNWKHGSILLHDAQCESTRRDKDCHSRAVSREHPSELYARIHCLLLPLECCWTRTDARLDRVFPKPSGIELWPCTAGTETHVQYREQFSWKTDRDCNVITCKMGRAAKTKQQKEQRQDYSHRNTIATYETLVLGRAGPTSNPNPNNTP